MPSRHGKIVCGQSSLEFRCEIRGVFNRLVGALTHDIFHETMDQSVLTPRTPFMLHTFALREHFNHMTRRLLHSLDALQVGLRILSRLWDSENSDATIRNPGLYTSRLRLDTEIAGDSALHYIAAVLDDVARLLPFADPGCYKLAWFQYSNRARCDSFTAAMRLTKANGPLNSFREVFDGLEAEGSWWSVAFKYAVGSRQRIVHYTDWTAVGPESLPVDAGRTDAEGWGPIDGAPSARLYVTRPGEDSAIDFCDHLRQVLLGLCEWLDLVERRLQSVWIPGELEGRAPWLTEPAPLYGLPIAEDGLPSRKLLPTEDFYLPTCATHDA